jgi:hypothetical protein
MKAKLNKVDNGYVLLVDNIMYATDNDKLSKQNCDEIFGVVDVERLAENIVTSHPDFKSEGFSDYQNGKLNGIIEGFNKAMELTKYKLFTVEDIMKAFEAGYETLESEKTYNEHYDILIQSLQQPTEIEVEIEYMFSVEENGESTNTGITKLDENGCLILKRI